MTELEKAAESKEQGWISVCGYTLKKGDVRSIFQAGAEWQQAKQSPWISVEKEEPPLDKPILVIIDGKPDIITMCDWDYITGYHINITHWMYIPEV